jgi:hypothetical protein
MSQGRRTLLTPQLQSDYVTKLQSGLGVKASARAVQLALPTMFRWFARGRSEQTGPYRDFYQSVQETLAAAERTI